MVPTRLPEVDKRLLKKLDKMDSEAVADLIYAWIDDEDAFEQFIGLLQARAKH